MTIPLSELIKVQNETYEPEISKRAGKQFQCLILEDAGQRKRACIKRHGKVLETGGVFSTNGYRYKVLKAFPPETHWQATGRLVVLKGSL